jgi:hypothetical protein
MRTIEQRAVGAQARRLDQAAVDAINPRAADLAREKGWRELLAWEEELERRAHLRDMERLGA